MRNRALIARWCLEHADGAMTLVRRTAADGVEKTYLHIADYARLRQLIATLLAEVQRIKSCGDYEAARRLVEDYAVQIDSVLHEEVLERYRRLDLAPYKGFVNPQLLPVLDADGQIADVQVSYSESYAHQMLRYSTEYGTLI